MSYDKFYQLECHSLVITRTSIYQHYPTHPIARTSDSLLRPNVMISGNPHTGHSTWPSDPAPAYNPTVCLHAHRHRPQPSTWLPLRRQIDRHYDIVTISSYFTWVWCTWRSICMRVDLYKARVCTVCLARRVSFIIQVPVQSPTQQTVCKCGSMIGILHKCFSFIWFPVPS